MTEAAAAALDSREGAISLPGDWFGAAVRGSRAYRSVAAALIICALLSAGLIALALTGVLVETQQVQTPALPIALDLSAGMEVDRVGSAEELLARLQAHRLWDIPPGNTVPPVLFANYPQDFDLLDLDVKKRAFLHALLPAALVAREEVARERSALLGILARFKNPDQLVFDKASGWYDRLSKPEIEFLEFLAAKYRSRIASDLLARVDTFPVSLIMAQAAMESSWGSSRFAEQCNNIFGMWTFGDQGLVPTDRKDGADHKVAVYDTILGSVRAYLLTLNRLPAYRDLRHLRRETHDPLRLAEGLNLYSQRGDGYVAELKQIIQFNQLERFDTFTIARKLPVVASADVRPPRP
ncbi:MAG: glucosaminidase domain-containing protein [Desulfobacteraceae bacterium]|nr:glucosaminidase domain-containing protein [Desulfobacteraceae bacterium]